MNRRPDRPDIVVFLTDQQRWDTTGVHGNPLDLTPNFDWMAVHGTHLSRTFTCQPVCAPARASLQTGLFASRTGVYRNGIALDGGLKTLAHYLKGAGYDTAYFGKWHLASRDPVAQGERGGYEHWLAANTLEFTSAPYATTVFDEAEKPHFLPGYRVDAIVDAAIRYLDRKHAKPLLLFVALLEPHHQNHLDDYPPPVGYRSRYTGRWTPPDLAALVGSAPQHLGGYWGMVKRVDEAFGRLLDAVRSLGTLEKTIVLFTSDHGNHFKTRNDEYKRSGHESSIRVPCALVGPGFLGGGRIERLVSLLDVAPTLLDCAGVEVPAGLDGRSLLPLVRDHSVEWRDDLFVQISESEVGRALRTERWKYGVVAPGVDGIAVSSAALYEESYLYDLYADPYELTNLVGMKGYEAVASELRLRLRERIREVEAVDPEIHLGARRPGGRREGKSDDVEL